MASLQKRTKDARFTPRRVRSARPRAVASPDAIQREERTANVSATAWVLLAGPVVAGRGRAPEIEFHAIDADHIVFALNNSIYPLSRAAPAAKLAESSP